jgi:hypothetical protein
MERVISCQGKHQTEKDWKKMEDKWDFSSTDHIKREIRYKKKRKFVPLNALVIWLSDEAVCMFTVVGKQQIGEKYKKKIVYRELRCTERTKFQKFLFSQNDHEVIIMQINKYT